MNKSTTEPTYWNVIWVECDRDDRLVMKRKEVKSEKVRESFIKKLEAKDNFIRLEAVYEY